MKEAASKKKRIQIVINELWIGGGAEKAASWLANTLHDREYEVEIVALYDGNDVHEVSCAYTALGVAPRGKVDKVFRIFGNMIRLRSKIRRFKPDVVLCFLEEASFTTLLTKKLFRLNVPVVVSVRNNVSALGRVYSLASKYLYRSAESIVCVTKHIAHDLAQTLNLTHTQVIYNMVDIEAAEAKAREDVPEDVAQLYSHDETLVAIGRLTAQKDYPSMLKAMAIVVKQRPTVRLVVIGEGEDRSDLEQLTRELGIQDNVHFIGIQYNVYAHLVRARAYILTSCFEGMPNTMLEAAAVGTPIISTDCVSGPREIIAPSTGVSEVLEYPYRTECGVLVPVVSAENSKEIITLLAEEIMLSLTRPLETASCVERVTTQFSPAHIAKQWEETLSRYW